jgi:hypothetical protein
MLKIVETMSRHGAVTLQLEGSVVGPWVEELRRLCARTLASGTALVLDVGCVDFVDRDGASLFRNLERRRVPLMNCSAFVTTQLEG